MAWSTVNPVRPQFSHLGMVLPHNVVEVLAGLLPMSLLREEFEKVRYAEVVKVLAL